MDPRGRFGRAIQEAPGALTAHLSRGLAGFGANYVDDFATARFGVPDDRNPADFLQRRPKSSKGIVNRSGSLSRSLVHQTARAARLADVELRIGFASDRAARIARVHELGTLGKGGALPDIVPKRAPFLAVPIRSIGAALSAKKPQVALLKRVSIPPRLGWRERWLSGDTTKRLEKTLKTAADAALAEVAKRSRSGA